LPISLIEGFLKLTNAEHNWKTIEAFTYKHLKIWDKIWYSFNLCTKHSTRIRALAIFLVFTTSLEVNWGETKNGRIFKLTPIGKDQK